MIITLLSWYLSLSILGWLALPLAMRLFSALPDRGYGLSRALGLILLGFFFWLSGSLGLVANNPGGLLFSLAILVGLSAWSARALPVDELRAWWRRMRPHVIVVEILFLAAFVGYALIRAYNPEASGTEKPMELAFINAILNSPSFPPHDPWLSGYAISYYYFGYVLVAMLALLTSTTGAVAFNMGLVLAFSLSAIGAYGIVFNLLVLRYERASSKDTPNSLAHSETTATRQAFPALLAPLFLLLVSNLEGLLHVVHGAGFLWTTDVSGVPKSPFWEWLDVIDLRDAPPQPLNWIPTRFWWWWRASRVVSDYDFAGNWKEIINEFPAFSYLLGDLHPHVLSMPFLLLVIGLALQLFLRRSATPLPGTRRPFDLRTVVWGCLFVSLSGVALAVRGTANASDRLVFLGVVGFIAGLGGLLIFQEPLITHGLAAFWKRGLEQIALGVELFVDPFTLLLTAIILGAVPFLNTWDFPTALALVALGYTLGRALERAPAQVEEDIPVPGLARRIGSLLGETAVVGAILALGAVLLYLPFYLGFASQAGGPLPTLIYPTRGAHLWIMFATLFIPLILFLVYIQFHHASDLAGGFVTTGWLVLALFVVSLSLGLAIVLLPTRDLFLGALVAPDAKSLFIEGLRRRGLYIGGLLTLVSLLGLILSPLLARLQPGANRASHVLGIPHSFALLLGLLGVLLILAPEFLYLRDQFATRMNTIFKFYFQGWLLLALVVAYGSAVLWQELRGAGGFAFSATLILVIAAGLVYPIFGVWSKTNGFQSITPTLDSTAHWSPDELAAAHWLRTANPGAIAEAVSRTGGSYTDYARMATFSGQPAVLGWMGHESQWRGGGDEMGSRQPDLTRLYCSRDWDEVVAILTRYNIRYIVVGNLERATYNRDHPDCPVGLQENIFLRNLAVGFQGETITIYAVPPTLLPSTRGLLPTRVISQIAEDGLAR